MEPTYRFQLYYDGTVMQYKHNSTASPSWQLTNKYFGYTLENVSIKIGSSLFNGYYYGDYSPSNFNNIISAISVGSEGNRPVFISLVGTTVRAWSSQSNFTCYVRIVKQA